MKCPICGKELSCGSVCDCLKPKRLCPSTFYTESEPEWVSETDYIKPCVIAHAVWRPGLTYCGLAPHKNDALVLNPLASTCMDCRRVAMERERNGVARPFSGPGWQSAMRGGLEVTAHDPKEQERIRSIIQSRAKCP